MPETPSLLQRALDASIETLRSLSELQPRLESAIDLLAGCLSSGHKLLVCGNGGSAAEAAHFATEFVVRFLKERPAYPAICLTSDGGLLSAAGNDYGFEEVFARQVAAFGQPGDVLICLSTSGNSRNVQRAVEEARARGLKIIALLGRDGGSMSNTSEIEFLVRSENTARIQEAHLLLLHVLCEGVEQKLASKEDGRLGSPIAAKFSGL